MVNKKPNFKTLIFDDFLPNPDELVEIANSQTYIQSVGRFPGRRTTELSVICNQIHTMMLEELLKKSKELTGLSLTAYFQKIPNLSFDESYLSIENSGWIHTDDSVYSGVLYLNKDSENYGGTSLYEPLKLTKNPDIDINKFKKQHYANTGELNIEEYRDSKLRYSELFEKTETIENVYNRLVLFNSKKWHNNDTFVNSGSGERLTLIFFMG
jgi:hypothetical protein